MVRVKEDLTGRRFDRLIVLEQTEDHISSNGRHRPQWPCQCDCGSNPVIVWGESLKMATPEVADVCMMKCLRRIL